MRYDFKNGKELLDICLKENKKIYEVMILREMDEYDTTSENIIGQMCTTIDVMENAINKGLSSVNKSLSGLIGGEGIKLENYRLSNLSVLGDLPLKVASASMAVLEINASMGKIVAAPTAGSSGIIPGSILTIAKEKNKNRQDIINSLLTCSAVGMLIASNSTVSGAEGGCQAEVGAASAMAAAGIVELMGGSPEQALNAAAFTIKNLEGLVCDPVAGLVECPCLKRNAMGSVNAMLSADLSMAGIKSIIPFDDVVDSMYQVGKALPETLKETSLGGLAVTKEGKKIEENLKLK